MSMTALGCGIADVLRADVENKLSRLTMSRKFMFKSLFDPLSHPGFMSDAAKIRLGFDLDYGTTQAWLPVYGEKGDGKRFQDGKAAPRGSRRAGKRHVLRSVSLCHTPLGWVAGNQSTILHIEDGLEGGPRANPLRFASNRLLRQA